MDIFKALRRDHDEQRQLIDQLVQTHGDTPERAQTFKTLKDRLDAHAGAEERHFYVPLMEHDLTQDKSRHSVAEHKELDDLVEKLEEYDPTGPAWLPTARELRDKLLHHLEEEEREVFQLAGKVLSDSQKVELVAPYDNDMARRTSVG